MNWFKNNPNLKNIDLGGNKIAHIPAEFVKDKLFQNSIIEPMKILLSMNPIETIADGAFDNIDHLYLYLEHTKLKRVTNTRLFKDVNQLVELYIDFDKVECYSKDELNFMKIAKKVIVRKRFLPKGCFDSFQNWGKENNVLVEDTIMPRSFFTFLF